MRKFLILTLGVILHVSVSAQVEYWSLPWDNEGEWKLVDLIENEDRFQYILNGENDSAGVVIYKEFLRMDIEQIMNKWIKEIQPDYGRAKMSVLTRHTSFQTEYPYVIFMVECPIYGFSDLPRSAMYHIVKGKDRTYIHMRWVNEKKLSGKTRKEWQSFFEGGELAGMDTGKQLPEVLGWDSNP